MNDFAKGARKVLPFASQSSEEEAQLDDITVNRGMYERLVNTSDEQARRIEQLEGQLAAAQEEIERLSQEIDDASGYGDGFASKVARALPDMSILHITETYNRKFFDPIPETVRVDVCNVLLSYFDANGEEPSVLWYSIVAKGGVL